MLSSIDWKLFFPAALLVSVGGLVLTSVAPAAYPLQFLYIALAALVFLVSSRIDFSLYKTLAPGFYVASIILLLVTLLFGAFSRGAVRWIEIGPLTLQTSEIVKPFVVLFVAWILTRETSFRRYFFAIIVALIPIVLVFIQPDLGSSIIIFTGMAGALFFGGLPWKVIIVIVLALGGLMPLLWQAFAQFQKDRILTFIQPSADPLGAGYNSIQALIAIGAGGFAGRGLGQGTQSQLLFLPERHTDFIFASIGEELGLLGAGFVILLFGLLFARIIFIFIRSTDDFSRIFAGGLFLMLFAQASINMGMNLGIFPITGIPLPFVSSGGSALLAMAMALGMLSSMGRSLRAGTV